MYTIIQLYADLKKLYKTIFPVFIHFPIKIAWRDTYIQYEK